MTDLSILIPTTPDRREFLTRLTNSLSNQIRDCGVLSQVEILINETAPFDKNDPIKELSIGYKRNKLLQKASGDYVAFIDSDDRISEKYICLLFEGIAKNPDCCSLVGEITVDGLNPLIFHHSIRYNEYITKPEQPDSRKYAYEKYSAAYVAWIEKNKMMQVQYDGKTDWVKYERYPNHLNCIRASIAKQFKFPEEGPIANHGEDTAWATQLHLSRLLKTEFEINEILYHYDYVNK